MQVKQSGAVVSRLIAIASVIAVMLGLSLNIASANGGDEGVEETPIVATATAETTDESVIEVQGGKDKGDKPEPKPTKSTPAPEPTVKPKVVTGDWGEWVFDCDSGTKTRTRDTVTYDVTYEKVGGKLVEVSRVEVGRTTESYTRDMTKGQKQEHCSTPTPTPTPTPDKPDPKSGEEVNASSLVCDPEGGGIVTTTTVSWTQDWVFEGGKWVLGDKVYGEPVDTTRPATDEECPAPKPTTTPTETEEPVVEPVAGDLLVQCAPGNRISLTNNHTWHALVIAGFDDENGNDVPLTYDVDVYSGTTEYIDITRVPSGTPVGYWIVWMDLEGGSESIENGGSITCGDSEPSEEPTPTQEPTPTSEPSPTPPTTVEPSPEPTPEPSTSVGPTPPQTVKPSPTAEPTQAPSETPSKSASPKPAKAPAKPSKSDPKKPSSTGVVDEPVDMPVGLAAAFGVTVIVSAGVIAVRRRLS